MSASKSYLCVAYGGATSLCPPGHTLESIRKALEIGATMVYVEARTTRGGDIVAWPSMQRMVLGEPVHLTDHSLAEWVRITAEDDAPVLALDDVLSLVASTSCGIVIDIREKGIENPIARKLRKFGIPYENVLVVSSESSRPLIRTMDPKIPTAHRFRMDHQAKITPDLISALDTDAVIWPPGVITPDLVTLLKRRGVLVYAGLVNLAQEMRRLRDDSGVDGIVTPYPDLLLDLPVKHLTDFRRAALAS